MPARKGKIWRNLDGYDSAPQFARQGEMHDAKLGGLPPMPQIIQLFAQEPYDVPNLRGGVLTGDKEPEPCGLYWHCGKDDGQHIDAAGEQALGQSAGVD